MANVAEWREIPGTAGNYLVSDDGRVWSRPRRSATGGVLSPGRDSHGYPMVGLWVDGKQRTRLVHSLVLGAFVGPRPEGMECRHLDGDKTNNRLGNLAWGTHSDNMQDRVRHGDDLNAAKLRCPRGHPYDEANTYVSPRGRRNCRECQRARERRSYALRATA